MSDPATDDEVEDVLSSIRRLVSEEKRPLQVHQSAPSDGRLMLTPALRVTEQNQPNPLVLGSVTQEERAENSLSADEEWNEEADDHSLEAYWEENPPGALRPNGNDILVLEQPERTDGPDIEVDEEEQVADPIDSSAFKLTAKIAALETAIGSIRTEFEPDEPGTDAYSGTDQPAMAWEDDVELDATGKPVARTDEDEKAKIEAIDLADEDQEEVVAQPVDEAAVDSAELGIAETEESGHETTLHKHDLIFDKPPVVDDELSDEQADPVLDAEIDQEDTPKIGLTAEDHLIDEDALRELVGSIVRSELQGALGERITRNVRKLVRREIHRALAAQELD